MIHSLLLLPLVLGTTCVPPTTTVSSLPITASLTTSVDKMALLADTPDSLPSFLPVQSSTSPSSPTSFTTGALTTISLSLVPEQAEPETVAVYAVAVGEGNGIGGSGADGQQAVPVGGALSSTSSVSLSLCETTLDEGVAKGVSFDWPSGAGSVSLTLASLPWLSGEASFRTVRLVVLHRSASADWALAAGESDQVEVLLGTHSGRSQLLWRAPRADDDGLEDSARLCDPTIASRMQSVTSSLTPREDAERLFVNSAFSGESDVLVSSSATTWAVPVRHAFGSPFGTDLLGRRISCASTAAADENGLPSSRPCPFLIGAKPGSLLYLQVEEGGSTFADCVGSPVMITSVSSDLSVARIVHATELSFRPKKKQPSELDQLKAEVYDKLPNFLAHTIGVAAEGKPLLDVQSSLGRLTLYPIMNDRILDTTVEIKPGYRVDLNSLTDFDLNPKVYGLRVNLQFRADGGSDSTEDSGTAAVLLAVIGVLATCLLCVGAIAVAAVAAAMRDAARQAGPELRRTQGTRTRSQRTAAAASLSRAFERTKHGPQAPMMACK
eukprot:CAMPEP_0170745422 /NCGR_PEP_ID=MMETSP0437-20130122/8285_1 /TAXON_ID=0 /ORGANISM="Sexangularia sp." /LENGTH=552 /DNA_ID=CAMNT_0011084141 /DNA_START=28 /DNA_END=1687 /DNA_ORIENTATION=-